jgi:hypothetical protein
MSPSGRPAVRFWFVADVAQLAEHAPCKREVTSSTLVVGSVFAATLHRPPLLDAGILRQGGRRQSDGSGVDVEAEEPWPGPYSPEQDASAQPGIERSLRLRLADGLAHQLGDRSRREELPRLVALLAQPVAKTIDSHSAHARGTQVHLARRRWFEDVRNWHERDARRRGD